MIAEDGCISTTNIRERLTKINDSEDTTDIYYICKDIYYIFKDSRNSKSLLVTVTRDLYKLCEVTLKAIEEFNDSRKITDDNTAKCAEPTEYIASKIATAVRQQIENVAKCYRNCF